MVKVISQERISGPSVERMMEEICGKIQLIRIQERVSECIAEQILDLRDAQALHAALAKANMKAD